MFVKVFWKAFFVFGFKKMFKCDIKVKTVFSVLHLTLIVNNFVLTIESKKIK